MFRHAVVDNLELDAAGDALAIPLANAGRGFGLSLIGHIVDDTAGYPYFLQFFGAFACSRIGLEHIKLADFQRIESALLHELDLAFFEDRFLTASSAEQELLLRMATRSGTASRQPICASRPETSPTSVSCFAGSSPADSSIPQPAAPIGSPSRPSAPTSGAIGKSQKSQDL